ncbi:MAG TPA: TonB-dependent receptor, partial [Novosphingobium sp.]|nr:TonB-dependent receptor [Novosphingobium sp.]
VTAGIRYTVDKTRAEGGTRQLFFFAPGQFNPVCAVNPAKLALSGEDCITRSSQTTRKPTWLINFDYKPNRDMLIYAKYARGYRQGNINASNTVPQGWGPEKVDTYEIGAKTTFRGALSGYFNVAAFYNDFTDQQLAASLIPLPGSLASPAQAIINAGTSRIQGVEVDALFTYSAFSLALGYSYLDTKLKSFTPLNFPGYLPAIPNSDLGGPLPFSPKHKLSLTPSVRLPLDESLGRVTLGATYVYTSSQVSSAAAVTPIGKVPSNELLNLNLSWDSVGGLPLDLAAFVTNVTNEKTFTFVGGGWQSTGIEYGTLGMPRMWGLRAKFRFGADAN